MPSADGKSEAGAVPGRYKRRDEVLAAAVEVFYAKGYPSASIQDVADRVGVLKGSLYHYIDSKEDLLADVFEGSDEQAFTIMEATEALDLPAVERLRYFVREWSLWHLLNLERAAVYSNEWQHLAGERLARVKKRRRDYERFVGGMIAAAKAEGDADAALDERYACFATLSAINGLTTWYRRDGPDSATHIATVYADEVVGLVCHPVGRSTSQTATP